LKTPQNLQPSQATLDFASLKIPKSKQIRIAAEEEMQSYESACRVTRRFKTFGYGLAQTFLETAPSSSSFLDEYMNLVMTAKEKQLLRSRKWA
jgi:hypothetical protein